MQQQAIAQIRAFNRFYTRVLKLVGNHHLETPYTLEEARILLAIEAGMVQTADLTAFLRLDKGYTSRLLKRLEGRQLLTRQKQRQDRRFQLLQLTSQGHAAVALINRRADAQVAHLFGQVPPAELATIMTAMARICTDIERGLPPESRDHLAKRPSRPTGID